MVGHNPDIEIFLMDLTNNMIEMKTASIAKITFKSNKWSEVESGLGNIEWH